MPDSHDLDRAWLVWIRTITTDRLRLVLRFEIETWRIVAVYRELERREVLASELQ